jgi:predicted NBD/HSP70 family sugar kinase
MYLGIDIGGTKTLVALLNNQGVIKEFQKFPTPKIYPEFLRQLAINVDKLSTDKYTAAGVAAPGKINRAQGIAEDFGNLPWHDVPIQRDLKKILKCPVVVDNDANLAGLSEAMLLPQYDSVLYVTISTGIGTGIITHQAIDPEFADSEGGHIMLEHKGKVCSWESFASGQAIVKRFGKRASEINDQATWKLIVRDIGLGLYDLIAFIQPDVVVLGGGVLTSFEKFDSLLIKELQRYQTPLTPIPPVIRAQRPDEAVVYGCFDLAKATYGRTS